MTAEQLLTALRSMGTEENRAVYARHGIGDAMYGVSYANLRALAKRAGPDPALADALWRTGNHDARALATMIAGSEGATEARAKRWARDLDNYVIADLFARWAWRVPEAPALATRWCRSEGEWLGRAGWLLVALLASERPEVPDDLFATRLEEIEGAIHGAKNRVREAMNSALIAAAIARPGLTGQALEIARRIGTVVVDHGETGGTTPDAVKAIREGVSHRQRREAGRAGGKKAAEGRGGAGGSGQKPD